jgi:predicted small secreted protein
LGIGLLQETNQRQKRKIERSNSPCSINAADNRNLNTNMTTSFKRIVVLHCSTTLLAIVGMGCNTANGFGKDVSNTGEGIQNGTK